MSGSPTRRPYRRRGHQDLTRKALVRDWICTISSLSSVWVGELWKLIMERLSGLDAFFLYLETPTQPLNVCCVMELDTSTMPGGYTFARFRDAMMLRVDAVPEFRLKLADSQLNLGHPVWFDDDDFQLDRHLHRVGLPTPGGRHEFAEVCGDIASLPLDRDHPLWEMWVIEDIADGNAQAVLLKAHHAVVDGVAGASLMAQLCSDKPDAP